MYHCHKKNCSLKHHGAFLTSIVGGWRRGGKTAPFTIISLIRFLIRSLGTQKPVGGYLQSDEG
jgi:hypothetical protein